MSTDTPVGGNGEAIPQPEPQVAPQPQAPPQTPPPEQLAYSPPPPGIPSVREAFASRGYDTSQFADDEQFIRTIESGLSQLSEIPRLQQMAQLGQQYASGAGQDPEPQVQETPDEPVYESDWQPPEFDKAWDSLLRMDGETGQYIPINEHVNPQVAQKANSYREWLRSQGQRFWDNPYDFMKDGLGDWVAEVADAVVQERMGQTQTNDQVTDFLSQNSQRFYNLDQFGNIHVDPTTGEESLTAEGQALKHYAQQAREAGMQDAAKIQEYAMGLVERDLYQGQAIQQYYAQMAQQSPPQQTAPQQTFLQGAAQPQQPSPGYAGYSPNRDASVASAAEGNMAQNDNLSFMDMAMPEMLNMGLVQQTG